MYVCVWWWVAFSIESDLYLTAMGERESEQLPLLNSIPLDSGGTYFMCLINY